MSRKKDVLTTGQVAQICNVAPRTVTKWFDSGKLKGYRIPGSKDRRIPTSELIRFMKSHDMPTDGIGQGELRIMVLDNDFQGANQFADAIKARKSYEVQIAENSFDAGLIAQKLLPHVIIINLMARDIDAEQVCKYVRSNEDLNVTKVVAIAENADEIQVNALKNKGFDGVISDTGDINVIIGVIQQVTSIIF